MAIGLAQTLRDRLPRELQLSVRGRSITEFWRRWHISLSSWFRDYLYIPLGGNRRGPVRTYVNLVIGLLPLRSLARRELDVRRLGPVPRRVPRGRADEGWAGCSSHSVPPHAHLYTLVVVAVGWVFFRADSLRQAADFLRAMAGFGRGSGLLYHAEPLPRLATRPRAHRGRPGFDPTPPLAGEGTGELLASNAGPIRFGLRSRPCPGRRHGPFSLALVFRHALGRGDSQPIHLFPVLNGGPRDGR